MLIVNHFGIMCLHRLLFIFLPLLLLSILSLPVRADEIYTWVDENGNRVYSDTPNEGAETVKLKPIMRMDFPEPSTFRPIAPVKDSGSDMSVVYTGLSWVTPVQSQTFPVGVAGNVAVAVQSTPNLQPGDQLEVFVNDAKVGTFTGPAGTLQNLPRGEHQLVAKIVSNGKVVGETAPRTIYVHRAKAGG